MQVHLQKTFRVWLTFMRQDPERACKTLTAAPLPSALLSTLDADRFEGVNADMGKQQEGFSCEV